MIHNCKLVLDAKCMISGLWCVKFIERDSSFVNNCACLELSSSVSMYLPEFFFNETGKVFSAGWMDDLVLQIQLLSASDEQYYNLSESSSVISFSPQYLPTLIICTWLMYCVHTSSWCSMLLGLIL